MKKTRIFYDIFSILLVLTWVIYLILSYTLGAKAWMGTWIMFIVLAVVSIAYTISIIVLAINLATKVEKEMPSLILIILGCLIIPVVGSILFYIFVLRKITKSVG
jgi:membrane protease YdiL (CAAX protease family)